MLPPFCRKGFPLYQVMRTENLEIQKGGNMVTEQRLMELTPFEKYPCSRVIDGEKMRFSVEPKQTVFVFGKSCRTRLKVSKQNVGRLVLKKPE